MKLKQKSAMRADERGLTFFEVAIVAMLLLFVIFSAICIVIKINESANQNQERLHTIHKLGTAG